MERVSEEKDRPGMGSDEEYFLTASRRFGFCHRIRLVTFARTSSRAVDSDERIVPSSLQIAETLWRRVRIGLW